MSEEIVENAGQGSEQQTQQGKTTFRAALHPAELRKAQKAAKEQAKLVEELQAKVRQYEEQGLSEVEKLRKRTQELEPITAQYEELRTFAESQRDARLAALPKEAREHLATVIEGLPAHKALAMIDAVSLVRGDAPKSAEVPRGGAPKVGRTLTLEQIANNPEALDGLASDQLAGLLGQAGHKPTGKVWGK